MTPHGLLNRPFRRAPRSPSVAYRGPSTLTRTEVPGEETQRTKSDASATRTGDDRCGGGDGDGGGLHHVCHHRRRCRRRRRRRRRCNATFDHNTRHALSRLGDRHKRAERSSVASRRAATSASPVCLFVPARRPSPVARLSRTVVVVSRSNRYIHIYTHIYVIRCRSAKKSATEETDEANRAGSEQADTRSRRRLCRRLPSIRREFAGESPRQWS